jgi:hypothetical protein
VIVPGVEGVTVTCSEGETAPGKSEGVTAPGGEGVYLPGGEVATAPNESVTVPSGYCATAPGGEGVTRWWRYDQVCLHQVMRVYLRHVERV